MALRMLFENFNLVYIANKAQLTWSSCANALSSVGKVLHAFQVNSSKVLQNQISLVLLRFKYGS